MVPNEGYMPERDSARILQNSGWIVNGLEGESLGPYETRETPTSVGRNEMLGRFQDAPLFIYSTL